MLPGAGVITTTSAPGAIDESNRKAAAVKVTPDTVGSIFTASSRSNRAAALRAEFSLAALTPSSKEDTVLERVGLNGIKPFKSGVAAVAAAMTSLT